MMGKITASNSIKYGIISVIMAVVIVVTVFSPISVFSAEKEKPYITCYGETVSEIIINEDEKTPLKAEGDFLPNAGYRWQIEDPDNDGRFIDITNIYSNKISVSSALIGSMLKSDGSANIRCRITDSNGEQYTDTVKVTVSFKVIEQPYSVSEKLSLENKTYKANDEEFKNYSIVINYLFDNGAMAFEPYGAVVAAGSDFVNEEIESPVVVGYKPVIRNGEDYIDAKTVKLNYTNIQQNITINVIYEPDLVKFEVHHHLQNLLDDDYSLTYDYITEGTALTGSIVGDGLAYTPEQLPGFTALAYEKLPVAADGSTTIEIRYDRNYYLIDFDMNGGYGTEPIYTRFGASVGVNDPVRHGYVFDGWELVSYGGNTPTAEQIAQYPISAGSTITVPAASLRYRARWITQQTNYTMVFWKENAENNGYSYWGYLDDLTTMSGSYVDGQDYISRVSGITDEQYFTFNSQKTEKQVLVEGDGSTVVNVYYTRNYYTISFKAPAVCTIPVNHTHTDACYDEICDRGHTHSDKCNPQLKCTVLEHTAHTDDCIICGKELHIHGGEGCSCTLAEHTHELECWSGIGNKASYVFGAPSNPQQAQVYRRSRNYYIYLFGSWYNYSTSSASSGDIVDPDCGFNAEHTHGTDCSCGEAEHRHNTDCFKDTLHTHNEDCYTYSCTPEEHTHIDACYRLKCGIPTGHTHNTNCTNANRESVVKTVTRKYQQNIGDIWPVADDHGNVYDDGQRWEPENSSYYSQVLVYIAKMQPENFTLTLNEASHTPYTMNYYTQVLDGDDYTHSYGGYNYELSHTIKASYNYVTKAEDFFDIAGFNQHTSNPAFSGSQISISGNNRVVNFYYNRKTSQKLEFNNNGIVLDAKTVSGVMYGAPLEGYNFTPEYPANLEPGAYTFDGWYASPGCFEGTQVDWQSATMAEDDMMFYAKWVPITHTVKVFKDATLTEQIGEAQQVDHKNFAIAPDKEDVSNGLYVFQGWFYMDEVNGVPTEKAFIFTGIPVVEDMNIYAKWSSHVSVDYKINYVLKTTGEPIADSTKGSAIAGHNKTFEAKTGADLYEGYQTGYYPLVNSHTITMSVDGTHEFTFEYVYVEAMPYTVEYIDSATGKKLKEDKVVKNNNFSVVTETFEKVQGMMPDAYQKRLILAASGEDVDNDGVLDNNRIVFYYNSDDVHAYYRVVHYIHSINNDNYREYRSEEVVGIIGQEYTVDPITLTGFEFNAQKTKVNGINVPSGNNQVTATLGSDGMLIELYYDRITVDYTVKYLLHGTQQAISPAKNAKGAYGEQIVEYAKDLTSAGYKLVGADVKTLNLSANSEHNVIEFVYQEDTVSIKYELIGPEGCGLITSQSENISAVTGSPHGSTPVVYEGFSFVGWFTDSNCTIAVDSAFVGADNTLVPERDGAVWKNVTYYAKFIALDSDLVISTEGAFDIDLSQAFLFRVTGKKGTATEDVDVYLSIIGNGTATVANLPLGDYTVTELIGWSWRYENGNATREITLEYNNGSNTIKFVNSRKNSGWLDGNTVKNNKF